MGRGVGGGGGGGRSMEFGRGLFDVLPQTSPSLDYKNKYCDYRYFSPQDVQASDSSPDSSLHPLRS